MVNVLVKSIYSASYEPSGDHFRNRLKTENSVAGSLRQFSFLMSVTKML